MGVSGARVLEQWTTGRGWNASLGNWAIVPYPEPSERGIILANALAVAVMIAAVTLGLLTRSDPASTSLWTLKSSETAAPRQEPQSNVTIFRLAQADTESGALPRPLAMVRYRPSIGDYAGEAALQDRYGWLAVDPFFAAAAHDPHRGSHSLCSSDVTLNPPC